MCWREKKKYKLVSLCFYFEGPSSGFLSSLCCSVCDESSLRLRSRAERWEKRRRTCSPTSLQLSLRSSASYTHTHTHTLSERGGFGLVLFPPRFTPAMSGSYCKSLYPFTGEQHQQGLSFEAGDVIKVVQAVPGGWWEGEKDGTRGWFPSSYVQVLEVRLNFLYIIMSTEYRT